MSKFLARLVSKNKSASEIEEAKRKQQELEDEQQLQKFYRGSAFGGAVESAIQRHLPTGVEETLLKGIPVLQPVEESHSEDAATVTAAGEGKQSDQPEDGDDEPLQLTCSFWLCCLE